MQQDSNDIYRCPNTEDMFEVRNNTDQNEKHIVAALRKIPGVSVETGHDDILVGRNGVTYWIEIKNPNEVDKNGVPYKRKNCKTYDKQKKLSEEFKGHYQIVSTLDEILKTIGIN